MIARWRYLEMGCWLVVAVASVIVTHNRAANMAALSPRTMPTVSPTILAFSAESLAAWSARVSERSPFHVALVDGRESDPAPVGWRPLEPLLPPQVSLPVLRGVLGGAEHWEAVLGDLPGRSGDVVVRAGDTVGVLRIRAIGARYVLLAGPDSVYRLTLGGRP